MMNRRGLLSLLGGAAAMPTVGVKTAADALGIDMAMNAPMPVDQVGCEPVPSAGWWGSPAQIAFEAKREADYQQSNKYAHMKSWSASYRRAVVAREIQVERIFQRKMEVEESYFQAVARKMGWPGA